MSESNPSAPENDPEEPGPNTPDEPVRDETQVVFNPLGEIRGNHSTE